MSAAIRTAFGAIPSLGSAAQNLVGGTPFGSQLASITNRLADGGAIELNKALGNISGADSDPCPFRRWVVFLRGSDEATISGWITSCLIIKYLRLTAVIMTGQVGASKEAVQILRMGPIKGDIPFDKPGRQI